ncbi:MAG TPA: class I SAM-dependent methyltransferase [Gemmatimonadales bacterium]|nr:class I SAM-dependent methyltransferase [Gemmatimonadales bacterium]
MAEGDLRQYQRKGPNDATRILLAAVRQHAPGAATLLDIGSGVGVIAHELLQDGVRQATVVDMSRAYLAAARSEAERRGTAGRTRFVHGDFVAVSDGLEPADVVTAERVVCCYPDGERLLATAAARCTVALALSYPRDVWYVRAVIALENLVRRLRGKAFRTFVHPVGVVRGTLERGGLRRVFSEDTVVWRVEVYVRNGRF